jgi:hypothetical protein
VSKQASPQQLFKQQQAMNKGLSVVGGVTALAGQAAGMINQAKQINTTAPTPTLDSFGKPMYNLGNFQTQVSAIKPQGASGGELLSGALQGAQGGAAFGPIGAGVGAVVGTLTAAFAGRRRKTLQERRKTLAQNNLMSAQRMYNQGIEAFNQRQSAQSLYNDQYQMAEQRMNNVYQALS